MPYNWVNQACGKRSYQKRHRWTVCRCYRSVLIWFLLSWITKTGAQILSSCIVQYRSIMYWYWLLSLLDFKMLKMAFSCYFFPSVVSIWSFFFCLFVLSFLKYSCFNENDVLKCLRSNRCPVMCNAVKVFFIPAEFHKCLKSCQCNRQVDIFFLPFFL